MCGREWCFLCGSPYGENGCESGCPQYGRDGRIPMRQRGVRFRQRQDFPTAVTLPAGLPPPVPPGVPEPQRVFAPPQPPPPPPVEEPGPLNHPDQGQIPQSESRRLTWRKYKELISCRHTRHTAGTTTSATSTSTPHHGRQLGSNATNAEHQTQATSREPFQHHLILPRWAEHGGQYGVSTLCLA